MTIYQRKRGFQWKKIAILKYRNGVSEKALKAGQFEKALAEQFEIATPGKADILVVLGGDGHMIRMAKKYSRLNKLFTASTAEASDLR